MEQEPRYLLRREYINSDEVNHCRDFINPPYGYYLWRGYPVYNALVLAIVTNYDLLIIEHIDDESNPSVFKELEKKIDGSKYWESYTKGFKEGFNEFRERPIAPYGKGSDEFKSDLRQLYLYGEDGYSGWLKRAKTHNVFISGAIFSNYGKNAGYCYGIDNLIANYPSLRDSIYYDQGEVETQTSKSGKEQFLEVPPQTLFEIWTESVSNGEKQYYNEVIQMLIQLNFVQDTGTMLQWRSQQGYISYCAGFIQTCINKGWIKQIYTANDLVRFLNNSFNVRIRSNTTFKQDALYSLDEKYLVPFRFIKSRTK